MIREQEIKLVLISNIFGLLLLPFLFSESTAQQRVSAVEVDKVISEPLLQTMPVLGRFVAKESGIVATRIAERVHKMYIQVGDRVKKGDLLGWFNMGSTVITLFSEGSCHWNEELEIGHDIQMGKSMGSINT